MSKMGSHDPFGYLKHKLWPKEGQFDFRPLKVRNLFDFLACRWRATYGWKTFDEAYNFFRDFTSIEGVTLKL